MESYLKSSLWRQLGAAIDMLENAIRTCPAELWQAHVWEEPAGYEGFSDFWYLAYHCIFWMDYYSSGMPADFKPPAPYTLSELDPAGLRPDRVYSPHELLTYLEYCRQMCKQIIENLSDETAGQLIHHRSGELPYFELLLDVLRHTQEHGAQLNLFLGQQKGLAARWVTRSENL